MSFTSLTPGAAVHVARPEGPVHPGGDGVSVPDPSRPHLLDTGVVHPSKTMAHRPIAFSIVPIFLGRIPSPPGGLRCVHRIVLIRILELSTGRTPSKGSGEGGPTQPPRRFRG